MTLQLALKMDKNVMKGEKKYKGREEVQLLVYGLGYHNRIRYNEVMSVILVYITCIFRIFPFFLFGCNIPPGPQHMKGA